MGGGTISVSGIFSPQETIPMPRYHFHIIDAVKVFDPEGVTLPDEQAAQHYARQTARSLRRALEGQQFKIRVTDERGQVVYEAHPDEH
jgi:hypothetical protein